MKPLRWIAIAVVPLVLPMLAAPAAAETAAEFFESIAGVFRGRGMAKIGADNDTQRRVTCQITNTITGKSSAGKFRVTGNCASSSGKAKVRGTIGYSGNSINGAFFSPGGDFKATRSSGSFKPGRLTVTTSFYSDRKNQLSTIRQTITRTAGGFKSVFYRLDQKTKRYVNAGSMTFKQK